MIEAGGPARLRREGKSWEAVPVETVRAIRHADALAVWLSLITRPDDWIVRRRQLRDELGIGEVRLRNAIRRLEELGLWEVRPRRGPDGRLAGREVVIRYVPNAEDPRCSVNLEGRESSALTHNRLSTQNRSTTHTRAPACAREAAPAGAGGGGRAKRVDDAGPAGPGDDALADLPVTDAQRRAIANAWRSLSAADKETAGAVLAEALAAGRVRDPVAYARSLVSRAQAGELAPPPEAEDARRSAEIERRAREIEQAVAAGAQTLVDGRPAALDDGYLLGDGWAVPLRAAIAEGRVTTNHMTEVCNG